MGKAHRFKETGGGQQIPQDQFYKQFYFGGMHMTPVTTDFTIPA